MKTYYVCGTAFKTVTLDSWENGSTSNSTHVPIDAIFKATSINDLLSNLSDFCNCDVSDAVLNACDEDGRVDFQVYENEQGEKASCDEMESFKKGEVDLFICDYSFYIEQVTSCPVTF